MTFLALIAIIFFSFAVYNLTCCLRESIIICEVFLVGMSTKAQVRL